MPKAPLIAATALLAVALTPAQAAPIAYTDAAAFLAAIAGLDATTETFDSTASGTVVDSGTSIGGLTFSYDFGNTIRMVVTSGDAFGGSLPAPTTSPANFLATNDLDVFVGGDNFTVTFAAAHAIGLYVVSGDVPGTDILDGDLLLSAGGVSASLDIDNRTALASSNFAYFLGIVDGLGTFATATLSGTVSGAPLYVVDDIVLARSQAQVPAPATAFLILSGLLSTAAARRRRRAA
jgi:hypothetical protein